MATSTKIVDVILQLRRDNDYNYKKVENTFVPAKGEVCFVDTARNGLRAKVGDSVRAWKDLRYIDEDIAMNVIVRGYLSNNQFYSDAELTNPIEASVNKIYIDVGKNVIYSYNGANYIAITQTIPAASSQTAGIMKLYSTTGSNTDGTMTQKAITEELNQKFEVEVDHADEEIIFSHNLF